MKVICHIVKLNHKNIHRIRYIPVKSIYFNKMCNYHTANVYSPVDSLRFYYNKDAINKFQSSNKLNFSAAPTFYDDAHIEYDRLSYLYYILPNHGNFEVLCPSIKTKPDSDDLFLTEIQNSSTVEEILDAIKQHPELVSFDHACQAIYSLSQIKNLRQLKYRNTAWQYVLDKDFSLLIAERTEFTHLLYIINEGLPLFPNRVTSLIMSLDNLQLDLQHDLMRNLYISALNQVHTLDLCSIAQLSFVFYNKGIKGYFIQSKMLSNVQNQIHSVCAIEDLINLSLFYLNTRKLISDENVSRYRDVIENFIDNNLLDSSQSSCLVLLMDVIFKVQRINSGKFLGNLLKLLEDEIHNLNPYQLVALNKVFRYTLEPRTIMHKIREHSSRLIEKYDSIDLKTELLLCLIPNSNIKMKTTYMSLVSQQVNESLYSQDIGSLYQLLRYLKIPDIDLHTSFWLRSLKNAKEKAKIVKFFGDEYRYMTNIYPKYMFFGNLIERNFRSQQLEEEIMEILTNSFVGLMQHIPNKVSNILSFFIGYTNDDLYSERWYGIIKENHLQFNSFGLMYLSKAIELQLSKKFQSKENINFITRITKLLDDSTEYLLEKSDSLNEVCTLMTAFKFRHSSMLSPVFNLLDQAHLKLIYQLDSQRINMIMKNYKTSQYHNSKLFDAIADYIVKNEDYVMSSTVHNVLSCFYVLGYIPLQIDKFATACRKTLEVECEQMPCHTLLETLLCLAWYRCLSPSLIHYVFNINFLDQLEEEIEYSYSGKYYSVRVRRMLMQLNRAVCLDYPEEKIPWFHQKYCNDQSELMPFPITPFHKEVFDGLVALLGNENLIAVNRKSPYFYNIDVEFVLSWGGRPIPYHEMNRMSSEDKTDHKKVALLLRKNSCYSSNGFSMKAFFLLQRRHLEILGYVVVEIPSHIWNSMAVTTSEDKLNLLKNLIYEELSHIS